MSVDMNEPPRRGSPLPNFADDESGDAQVDPKKPVLTPDQIQGKRDALFEKGSEFKPTGRPEVVGIDNVLMEIDQIIHWLRHSKEYKGYDSRLEPGVIFEGDPGTGKTLVSRYIATASDALFVNIRDFEHQGSLFRDADIADLFRRARAKYKETGNPIVMFWDEFENGACERGNATPEQAATVSQLTAELDGIHGKNEGILLIGCTNYIYGIDNALRRSGRMGVQIEFHAPDRAGKKLLLEYYLGIHDTDDDIDLDTLSYFFDRSATAADIEEACVEAWRHAVRRHLEEVNGGHPNLTQEDLVTVFLKRLVGPPSSFVNLPMEDRERIAIHECGHAIMALVYDIPLRLITVQPGKKALGRCITAEVSEYIGTVDEMVADMRVGLGSIVAEEVADVPASVGSTGDVMGVNKIAARLVENLYSGERTGMYNAKSVSSVRTARDYGVGPNVSQAAVKDSDDDVREIICRAHDEARAVMGRIGKSALTSIAKEVNEAVTLTGEEFGELFYDTAGDPTQYSVEGLQVR